MVIKLREHPAFCDRAANWFSDKWGIPAEAYRESMRDCISQGTGVPQWYLVLNHENKIIAGAGIIENDFHDRKDLSPNLCALFVEQEHRGQGIARRILHFARQDLCSMGIQTVYLVTDHTAFYEKCGWTFLTMVRDDDGNSERMYTASTM